MANEMFDIVDVKNEYITAVGQSLTQQFNIQAIEAGFVILNDFCNNVRANNMVLVRVATEPEQQRQPEPARPITPQRVSEFDPTVIDDNTLRQEYEKRMKAEEMRKRVEEMNKNLAEEPPQSLRSDINLRQEKPKSFIDKVKSYKPETTNINDDDDE